MNGNPPKNLRLYARLTIFVFLVLLVFLGWQIPKFEIDASADTLLVKNDRNYLLTQEASKRYEPEEFILVAFKPSGLSIFSDETRKILQTLTDEIGRIERVKSVRSLLNMPIFYGLDGLSSDLEPTQLTWEARGLSGDQMERILANHPIYEGLLINEGQTAIAMQVVFETPPNAAQLRDRITNIETLVLQRELTEDEELELELLKEQQDETDKILDKQRSEEIQEIRQLLNQFEDKGDFYLGGNNLLAHQLIEIIRSDLIVFGAAIIVIVALVLFMLFRYWHWVVLPLITCAASVTFTLGLLGLLELKVTVISANVVALQIILTLAMIIHLIVQYQELAISGKHTEPMPIVWEALKRKFKPCFYAAITTAIGFGALIFSGVQPVISFGWMMVAAMLVTLLVSLAFFPALLICLVKISNTPKEHPFLRRMVNAITDWVLHYPASIVVLCTVILVAGAIGCFRLTAENSFLNYFSDSTDVYRELTFIDQEFGGSTPLDLLYRIPPEQQKSGLIITADAVQTLQKIQNALEEKEAIGNITSVVDFARIARVVTGKPLVEYELTALYHALGKDLKADIFTNYFSVEEQEVRVSMRIQDATPDLNRAELIQSIHQDMASLGIDKEDYQLTNLFVLYQDILGRLVESQFMTIVIVYGTIAAVLMVVFHSLRIALICLVPNLVTTAAIMGGMGLFNIPLDLMTITIAAVAMGISVDDTIHYTHRFLQNDLQNPDEAVRVSLLTVGYAMVYTTIIIVIGFSSLMFSDFIPSVLFGLLTSITMLVALLADLTILPVLLHRFIKRAAHPNAAPAMPR